MEYSRQLAGRMQLDEYVAEITKIYGSHDSNRSLWDVWCHTLHHAAAVAERSRKEAPANDLCKEVADFALWLFTAVHKLHGQFGEAKDRSETPLESLIRVDSTCSDVLWHRYPGICPSCYTRRTMSDPRPEKNPKLLLPCDCLVQDTEITGKEAKRAALLAVRNFSEETRNNKPESLDAWQEMFATMFSGILGSCHLRMQRFTSWKNWEKPQMRWPECIPIELRTLLKANQITAS